MVGISVQTPVSIQGPPPIQSPDSGPQASASEYMLGRMYSAQRPLILVDGESRRCGTLDQIDDLIQRTGWPTWTTTFGKGLVNEQVQSVHGVYHGVYGAERSKAYFESADLVIHLGPHLSETNSQGFTGLPNEAVTVSFMETAIEARGRLFQDVSCRSLVMQLLQTLDTSRVVHGQRPPRPEIRLGVICPTGAITQAAFYRFVNPLFCSGDTVLTESGTTAHGGRVFQFPANVRMLTAATWLSIGYMLPATLGAALARCETREREAPRIDDSGESCAILFIGDGSLQMSVQELSTTIKQNINAIIFIINNDGYTIERAIRGGTRGTMMWPHGGICRLSASFATTRNIPRGVLSRREKGGLSWRQCAGVMDSGLLKCSWIERTVKAHYWNCWRSRLRWKNQWTAKPIDSGQCKRLVLWAQRLPCLLTVLRVDVWSGLCAFFFPSSTRRYIFTASACLSWAA